MFVHPSFTKIEGGGHRPPKLPRGKNRKWGKKKERKK